MKTIILGFILLLSVSGAAIACPLHSQPETAQIKINTQKRLGSSRITLRFEQLVEDSRCPAGTNCIWAGNAKIKVRASKNGRTAMLELNTNIKEKPAEFAGYMITLVDLKPERQSDSSPEATAYVATISVARR